MNGLSWVTEIYRTGKGAPVRVYTMTADPERVTAICGTPHADPVFRPKVIQRVMEEAEWKLLPKAIDDIANGRLVMENGRAVRKA